MIENLHRKNPELILGGMGVGITNYKFVNEFLKAGERLDKPVLGIVSGTALPVLMLDRLFRKEPDTIRALNAFPIPEIAKEILDEYLPEADKIASRRKLPPKPEVLVTGTDQIKRKMIKLVIVSAFVEVYLAKEGHSSPVGINLLEKIQLMHLPTILGAMLAGVNAVFVGAGIPNQIPEVLENFAKGQPASYKLYVESNDKYTMTLDPMPYIPQGLKMNLPLFFAIVSHHALAERLAKTVKVDGFYVENWRAGGHNAPSRGKEVYKNGEPKYGKRDIADIDRILKLGKLVYVAGGALEKLKEVKKLGINGIAFGTAGALCIGSGLREDLAKEIRKRIAAGTFKVKTDIIASPSGFPFKVGKLSGTLSHKKVYKERDKNRICNLGYLEKASKKEGVTDKPIDVFVAEGGNVKDIIVFRCPAEPVDVYVRKGGKKEDTVGKVCLCNGLCSTAGHTLKTSKGTEEPPIVTLGKDLRSVRKLIKASNKDDGSYFVEDVINLAFS